MSYQPCALGTARLANFRLGYTARMAQIAASEVGITLGGVNVRARVAGLSIRDVLNDAPNSCTLRVDGLERPINEQALRIVLGRDDPHLLFDGTLQAVDLSYEGWPPQRVYPCLAVDDTFQANRRRPFGSWVNVSATTYAQQLIAQFAPGFTTVHVQAGLPPVTITLDGTEGMSGALKQGATQIGGYFYFEDGDLHFFITETLATPDPIDGSPGRLLAEPPIRVTRDDSQLRTRQCGRAHGEPVLADVPAGDAILPIANAAAWFNTPGSQRRAIALSQRLTYTGVQAGGGGSMVGPGQAPSVGPRLTLVAGSGLSNGTYQYGYQWTTAAGHSALSPLAAITTGPVTPPAVAPVAALNGGTGVDDGVHDYVATFTNAAGETTVSPISNAVTTFTTPTIGPIANPPAGAAAANAFDFFTAAGWLIGDSLYVVYTYLDTTTGGETLASPPSNTVVVAVNAGMTGAAGLEVSGTTLSGNPRAGNLRVYINRNGSWIGYTEVSQGTASGTMHFLNVVAGGAPPGANTTDPGPTYTRRITLSPLPLSTHPTATGGKLYRRNGGSGPFKFVSAYTGSSYVDTTPNASLGASAPVANTALANVVAVDNVAIGPGATTGRTVYRTVVNGSQPKLLGTLPNNTATILFNDVTPDASLGANAPAGDTSGLAQIAGQVNVGSTSLPTASAAPFDAGGGFVALSGGQIVRYTGISGNTLTGIPATGSGAIITTVLYGSQVTPSPALLGVSGNTLPIPKGTVINIWVQRDDLAAQADQAAVDAANGLSPADGVYEGPPLVDERRNEASMRAWCDATLALYARPIVTVRYDCRDLKSHSGATVVIDLDEPPIHETLTIQEVTITEIDIAPGLLPRFSVTASSTRFSLDDIIRRLLSATDSVTSA